ncbi:hypothetical protein NQ315_008914 [Exocentrus adspersus]|uniref:DDE-1 domain-containing protein n=1 Tax=Exocentrus adspersus TaxID=1586481 RepID=A0AAV8VBZ2_9CUCU|nr:hypothetical protein NQ315_008914 [Exocentrus adspersus]
MGIDLYGLRLIIKGYLDRQGKTISEFKDNLPGREFAIGFMTRHKENLAVRFCQNIKRVRARVSPSIINDYFNNLEETLRGVPPTHIVNFDETNLSIDPGRCKIITKRGCKYPERVINQTKSAPCLSCLPPQQMVICCHAMCGWFDSRTFTDWLQTVAIPYLEKLDGIKVLIGDNLSSHLSVEVVSLCKENNIRFVFLPGNSTHLTQPLDIAFFRPLKAAWRKVLLEWKRGPGMKEPSVPKSVFPRLFARLINEIDENSSKNIQAGFCKAGIVPLNRNKVLDMIPKEPNEPQAVELNLDNSFCELLREMRYGEPQQQRKTSGKKIPVEAGKSVYYEDTSESNEDPHISLSKDENSSSDLLDFSDKPNEESSKTNDDRKKIYVQKHRRKFVNVAPVQPCDIQKNNWLVSIQKQKSLFQ